MEMMQLKGFCTVVETGSFSKAAKMISVTQPAISLQIKSLEEEFGEKLLDRGKKRILLTDAGRVLYHHAKRIFEEIDIAQQEMHELQDVAKGHLTIGCSETISTYILSSVLNKFIKKYPLIEVSVQNRTSTDIILMLLDHVIEIGLVPLPVAKQQINTVALHKYNEVAVVSRSHPLKKSKKIDLKSLSEYKLLVLEDGTQTRNLLDKDFINAGVTPVKMLPVGSVEVQKSFAEAGMGVAIVPDFTVKKEIARKSLLAIPIKDTAERSLGLAVKQPRVISPAALAFVKLLNTCY